MTNTPPVFPPTLVNAPGWEHHYELSTPDGEDPWSGYLYANPGDPGDVTTTVDLSNYRVMVDLDEDGSLVGVEILAWPNGEEHPA